MNYNEILKKVNPIYFSAKGCLGLLAETGDSDIVNFYESIDKEQLTAFDDNPIIKGRIISLEVRYHVWNEIAKETDCQTIVDLPCGYLPHSLTAARLNKNYYGFDLPIVTDEISRVAEKFLNQSEKYLVQYHGVDATNYFSMRDALKDVHGQICIITDGLLGHFNCDDLKIFCENIHRLLMEFGGCWYTTDSHFTALMSKTYAAITGKDEDVMTNATARGRKKVGEFDKNETVFTNGTFDERRKFLEDSCFTVESFRYPDKINFIPSLKDNPDLMKKVLSSYKDMEFWQLTAKATDSTEKNFDIPFAQNFSVKDNILFVKISGRLDTITAPKLLQQYEEYQAENNFTEIHIDAAELEYISYAGLRVLKIMRDSLQDENLFKVENANDEVKKILQ